MSTTKERRTSEEIQNEIDELSKQLTELHNELIDVACHKFTISNLLYYNIPLDKKE